VDLNISLLKAPFICFRIVTRGDYPELVRKNVGHNMSLCNEIGLQNFIFEIVTDKTLNMPQERLIREIVVPADYRTKTGAKFKSRALQYCLEDHVYNLRDNDWIVHLDEETIMTKNSIHGISNFCEDGNHHFGQGVICYGQAEIINVFTTLCDSFRVADDMGKLQFQLKVFHKPLFGWKGSYVVSKAGAERKVSFDHGLEGSIAEDCFFSMIAYRDGHSFDFIKGEMHEKSPFTFSDLLKQRRRWLHGITLTVNSKEIPWRCKFFLASSLYAWYLIPISTLNLLFAPFIVSPSSLILDLPVTFIGAVTLYMYMFGALKSFSNKFRHHPTRIPVYLLGALFSIPCNIFIENLAAILGLFPSGFEFYVVKKDVKSYITV